MFSIFLQCIPEDSGKKSMYAKLVSVPAPSSQLVVGPFLFLVSCWLIIQKITHCQWSVIFCRRLQKISLTLLTPCSEILWCVSCLDAMLMEKTCLEQPAQKTSCSSWIISPDTPPFWHDWNLQLLCLLFPYFTAVLMTVILKFSNKRVAGCCRSFLSIIFFFFVSNCAVFSLQLYHFICFLLEMYSFLKHSIDFGCAA